MSRVYPLERGIWGDALSLSHSLYETKNNVMQSTLGQVQWASAPTKSGSNSNKNKNNNNSAQQSETKAERQKRGGKKNYGIV